MTEVWKSINGFDKGYMISSTGRIRDGEKILPLRKHHRGHLRVELLKNGKIKKIRVHRLVAEAFIPNPNNYPVVNHKDGNMENNNVTNLEWCTQQYNVLEGLRLNPVKNKSYPLKALNKITMEEKIFNRMTDAENFVRTIRPNVQQPRTPIRDCCNGKLKSAYGYYWEYIKEE